MDIVMTNQRPSDNPNGIVSSSPGLTRQASTLGNRKKIILNPEGVASFLSSGRVSGRNPFRVVLSLVTGPRVAAGRQPWAGRRNPFGIQPRAALDLWVKTRPEGRAPGREGFRRHLAFTLIELLVVIAVIAVLAALIVGIAPKAFDARTRNRIETEMQGLTTVIESYQDKHGSYPPDNPMNDARPPLYYELTGTTNRVDPSGTRYFGALDNSEVSAMDVQTTFNIPGFLNTAPTRDEVKNFHPTLTPGLIKDEGGRKYIVASAKGPDGDFNPWRYDAHSPERHNPESFDLWAVIVLRGENVTIGNWRRE